MQLRRWMVLGAAGFLSSGCLATTTPLVRQQCYNPDVQLAKVLEPLEAAKSQGCMSGPSATGECDRLRAELERLTVVCPGHPPTLMTNAVFSYDERHVAKAQFFLDQILAMPGSHADAAVLRARVAIDEGNLPFAKRLLEQQINIAPDHAGLHETYGAALYLTRELAGASRELTTADALGAPRWRTAYHLGLIEEASGRLEQARKLYAESVTAKPGWQPAESRLRALRAMGAAK